MEGAREREISWRRIGVEIGRRFLTLVQTPALFPPTGAKRVLSPHTWDQGPNTSTNLIAESNTHGNSGRGRGWRHTLAWQQSTNSHDPLKSTVFTFRFLGENRQIPSVLS